MRIPAAILFDRANGRCVLMAEAGQGGLLDSLQRDLDAALPPLPAVPGCAT
jgi:anthranilate synthase component I